MNKILLNLCLALFLVFVTSCTSEDIQESNNSQLLGSWKLNAWNINNGFDMNNDGVVSTNLLNEIDCSYQETLLFEPDNVVSLNTTFNPDLDIVLLNNSNDEYRFNVGCDTEGVVSLATLYTLKDSIISFGNIEAVIDNNKISIVYKNKIEIYNEDLTEVVETKDLTLVYVKQ